MAAQARLFYPVRCAAISLGPPYPAYPKPLSCPNSLCRQSVILQNEPNLQKTKMNLNPCPKMAYEKNHPSRLCENEPNRTQFSSSAPSHSSLNAERYTLNAVIMQNKPNLQKCKNEPNYLFAKDLRKIIPVNSVSLAYNSAHFESTNACLELFRDNSRQLALIRDKTFCGFVLPRLDAEPRRVAKNLCGL
jgi:hypothetical protein